MILQFEINDESIICLSIWVLLDYFKFINCQRNKRFYQDVNIAKVSPLLYYEKKKFFAKQKSLKT